MKASLTAEGSNLYEVQEDAHRKFQDFFGEIPYQVTTSHARPGVVIRSQAGLVIASWEADYEAEAVP